MQIRHREAIGGYDEARALFAPSRSLSFEQGDRGHSLFDDSRDVDFSANDRNRRQADAHERKTEQSFAQLPLSVPATDLCCAVMRAWSGKVLRAGRVPPSVQSPKQASVGAFGQEPQTPEAALIAKADARRLEAAIAELPVPFRETLVLRDVQGLDYREIAEVTKVPIGTVMSRLARARRRLIERIGTDEPRGGA